MKKLFLFIFAIIILGGTFTPDASAQDRTITIFLVRHAEKASVAKDEPNPPLSEVGRERAERLGKVLGEYRPNRIMATDTIRARDTVEPLARKRRLSVEIYDPRKLPEVADFLKGLRDKRRVVVVGHSNTTAVLANLLFGNKTFNNLDESEYDKIFIIRMKRGKIRIEVRTY